MGLYDYLTLATDKTKWTDQLAGAFSISLGDNVSAFIGSGRQTHIVGDEIKYVLDWERFLEEILHLPEEGLIANVWNVLAGTGGNVTFTFGRNIGLTYLGPKIDIRRGPCVRATGQDNFFLTPPAAPGVPIIEQQLKASIDKTTGVIVALLSTAMVAVNTGLEIKAKIDYQKPATTAPYSSGKPDDQKTEQEKQHEEESAKEHEDAVEKMENFRTIVWMLTNRLMAFIIQIEKCAAVARTAATDLANAMILSKEAETSLELCMALPTVRQAISHKLDAAGTAIDNFIVRNKDVLIVLGAILGIATVAAVALISAFVLSKN